MVLLRSHNSRHCRRREGAEVCTAIQRNSVYFFVCVCVCVRSSLFLILCPSLGKGALSHAQRTYSCCWIVSCVKTQNNHRNSKKVKSGARFLHFSFLFYLEERRLRSRPLFFAHILKWMCPAQTAVAAVVILMVAIGSPW
jgi:hypothetical protein